MNNFLLNDIAHQLELAQQFALLREQQRAANRRYYERNKPERAAYHKQWYEANKERLQEHYRNRQRERRNTATAGSPDLTDE